MRRSNVPYEEEKKVRNYCVMVALALGLSRKDVGYVFDVTPERVRQISLVMSMRMRKTVRNQLGQGYYERLCEVERLMASEVKS